MMKKLLILAIVAIAAIIPAAAQRGETRIGADFGVAPSLEKGSNVTNVMLDAKVQFGVTNNIRLEGKLGYGFRDDTVSAFTLEANAQYLFKLAPGWSMYPLVGVGYGRPNVKAGGYSHSYNRFLFNVGLSTEYNITSRLAANIEVKYQYMDDFSRFPITVGVSYAF